MATPPTPQPTNPEMPMAEAINGAPLAPAQGPAGQRQGLQKMIWFGLVILTLLFISPATVMLLFFGLLPSFVALIIDRSEGKYATFCVLGLNFSGLFPFLSEIWFETHSIDAATNIMTDVFSLLIIYGSAGFGWMLYLALPPAVTSFLSVMSERRVAELKETQADIVAEWGEGVAQALEGTVAGEMPPEPGASAT